MTKIVIFFTTIILYSIVTKYITIQNEFYYVKRFLFAAMVLTFIRIVFLKFATTESAKNKDFSKIAPEPNDFKLYCYYFIDLFVSNL